MYGNQSTRIKQGTDAESSGDRPSEFPRDERFVVFMEGRQAGRQVDTYVCCTWDLFQSVFFFFFCAALDSCGTGRVLSICSVWYSRYSTYIDRYIPAGCVPGR